MSHTVTIPRYTLDDYLATEPKRSVRHEYVSGEIYAMAGASWQHNVIVSNLNGAIWSHLRGTSCTVVTNDRKVLVEQADSVYYPDVLVRCINAHETIDDYTETQPHLIIEVLSPSTEQIDRREKRLAYQKLASLQDYILVAQDQRLVEVYHRALNSPIWHHTEYRADDTVIFASIEQQLAMSIIYEDIGL